MEIIFFLYLNRKEGLMKMSKAIMITAVTLALSLNNFASAQNAPQVQSKNGAVKKTAPCFNVAIVDVPKLVEASPKMNALKKERKNKIDELAKFVETARTNLSKETNDAKRKSMEENYNKEINAKKDEIDKDYVKKLQTVDKEVTAIIKAKAKAAKYDLVLTKNSVLDGGTDITSQIIKELK